MSDFTEEILKSLNDSIEMLEKLLCFAEFAHSDVKNTYEMTKTVNGFSRKYDINREELLELVLEDTFNVLFFEIDTLKLDVLNKLKKKVKQNETTNE